jgi:diguanylate cyclase (GGDEF)-like protein
LLLSISFVVTGPRAATLGSLGVISVIAAQPELFITVPERVAFVVTALLVAGYGWFFNASYRKQRQQLEVHAHEDPLTRASNRRRMRQDLMETVSSVRATDHPALLAVLDLDRFKAVNDAYGHEMGDKVLVKFADLVRGRLRSHDGFYRLGGEEFVVLLRATSTAEGRAVLEDLRHLIEEGMQSISMAVTVSIGAVSMRGGDDWSTWLRHADAAMYQAKEEGRNRVVVHDLVESDSGQA